jgi:hypothetical protein
VDVPQEGDRASPEKVLGASRQDNRVVKALENGSAIKDLEVFSRFLFFSITVSPQPLIVGIFIMCVVVFRPWR